MSFKNGQDNPKWKGGTYNSDRGYRRLGTKLHRGKYEHRLLIEELLRDDTKLVACRYVFPKVGIIPSNFDVHHLDHRQQHNCYGNLMLLDKVIHRWIEKDYKKWVMENYEEWVEYWKEDGRWE